jgi:hypothetical protein
MLSRPPRITTGNTLSPTSDRREEAPSMLPQMMPPAAAANPAMAHDRANTLDTRIPTTIAACWSSATARMAIPSRLRVKNSPKAIKKTRAITAATTLIGEMNTGPIT